MKDINVMVIGAGLYVCGKGTEGFGTITGSLGNLTLKRKDFLRSVNPIYSFSIFGKDKQKMKERCIVFLRLLPQPKNS